MKKTLALSFLVFGLGCATAEPVGPTPSDFARTVRAYCPGQNVEIRNIKCEGYAEEPTEFTCRYQARGPGGSWRDHMETVAIDGSNWVLLSSKPDYCSGTKSS